MIEGSREAAAPPFQVGKDAVATLGVKLTSPVLIVDADSDSVERELRLVASPR